MSEYPPKKLDLDLTEGETTEKPLGLDLSNETATKESLDAAESVAKVEAVKAYMEANRRKVAEAEARREVEKRLGIKTFTDVVPDTPNAIEEVVLQTGGNQDAVRRYEEQRAEAQNTEANPFTPNVTDLEEMRAARAKQAEEDAETRDMLEKMRKTA